MRFAQYVDHVLVANELCEYFKNSATKSKMLKIFENIVTEKPSVSVEVSLGWARSLLIGLQWLDKFVVDELSKCGFE